MAKIQIKRGLQAAVSNLVLSEGELAVALDTGNVYVGTNAGTVLVNPTGGTADEAVKLRNAREFSVSGDGSAPAVSFNGTQNVQLVLSLATMAGLTAGTYTKLTVDSKGRVTAGAAITVEDLPSVPSSKITGLGTAAGKNAGTAPGNVVVVGSDGKIDPSIIPDLAITDTFLADSQSAMLALNAQKGDVCIRSDESKSYILTASPASVLANWALLKTPGCSVLSVNGKTGAVTIAEGDVHTALTARAAGLYKVTVDAYGHITGAVAVTKADITALGIPAQDTTYSLPTASASVLGGIKVGSGLSMAADGALSVGDIDGGTF